MTYTQIVDEVQHLSEEERLALIQVLIQSFNKQSPVKPDEPIIPFLSLRGILKPEGKMPTDEEIKQDYMEYLEEKYR